MDKHRIKKWCMGANVVIKETTEPTKSTIAGLIIDAGAEMTDRLVPLENRTLYIPTKYYKLLKQNPDYLGVDSLGKEALTRGVVGEFDGNKVKPIPTSYMPAGVYFFIKYKGSTVDPVKLAQYDILKKVKGYSGPVVQGVTYYDSFVLGTKGDGIAVCGQRRCSGGAGHEHCQPCRDHHRCQRCGVQVYHRRHQSPVQRDRPDLYRRCYLDRGPGDEGHRHQGRLCWRHG